MLYIPIEALQAFGKYLHSCGKLSSTIHCYSYDIAHFLQWLSDYRKPCYIEDSNDIQHYLDDLRTNYKLSQNSLRRKLISIKMFFNYHCAQLRPSMTPPTEHIPIPPRDDSLEDVLTPEDIEKLLASTTSPDNSYRSYRDPALIALLCFEGIKSYELISLKWQDLNTHKHPNQHITFTIRISGARKRCIVLSQNSSTYVQKLKEYTSQHPTFSSPQSPLFCPLQGKSALPRHSKMSRHGIKFMLYERANTIHIETLHSEKLRHYAITYQLAKGHSSYDIQKHLGVKRQESIARHIRQQKRCAVSYTSALS
ncbi:MAG: tyrosine-type recombinase/integrase [Proteobacteria bacterium]|nr:tyrosine-type recombinase/integrase [Pseudomonadota bacterium]